MFIDNQYVVLYNTSDYAIVSEFSIEDNNIINTHNNNNNIMKISLDNKE